MLVGIGYRNRVGREGTALDPIPTSIPNVRAFEKFLKGTCSLSYLIPCLSHNATEFQDYTNIIVMTDEDGVEEKYQPTKDNLVRRFSWSRPISTHPNQSLPPETRT